MLALSEENGVYNSLEVTPSSDGVETRKKEAPRNRRPSRKGVIACCVALGVLLLSGGVWMAIALAQYHHVDPAYTEAIQKIVDEHPEVEMHLPTWMIPGFYPSQVDVIGAETKIHFVSELEPSHILKYTYSRPEINVSYNTDTDRLYVTRINGMDYVYTEIGLDMDYHLQCVYWRDGKSSLQYGIFGSELLDEKDLLHIATSVKRYEARAASPTA